MTQVASNIIQTLLKASAVLVMVFGFALTASAGHQAGHAPSIQVVFQETPMFLENNLVPGETISRSLLISNTSNVKQEVFLQPENIVGCDWTASSCVASQLVFTIDQGGKRIYQSSLQHLYRQTLIPLGTLGALEKDRRYDLSIYFRPEASNEFQDDTSGFNMVLGFKGEQTGVIDTPGPGGGGGGTPVNTGGGGGGGGIVALEELVVRNVRVTDIDVTKGTAILRWETNLLSTSQAVYGFQILGPYSLDLSKKNFGYPFGTVLVPALVTEHSVQLSGLIAGQSYVYRVSSRKSETSLPSLSPEFSFTLGAPSPVVAGGAVRAPRPVAIGRAPSQDRPPFVPLSEWEGETTTEPAPTVRNAAAAFLGLPTTWSEFFFCLAALILIYLLGFVIWRYLGEEIMEAYMPHKDMVARRDAFVIAWSVIALLLALLFRHWCVILPIIIVILIVLGGIAYRAYKKRKGPPGGKGGAVGAGAPMASAVLHRHEHEEKTSESSGHSDTAPSPHHDPHPNDVAPPAGPSEPPSAH